MIHYVLALLKSCLSRVFNLSIRINLPFMMDKKTTENKNRKKGRGKAARSQRLRRVKEKEQQSNNCNLEASVDSATCADDLMTEIQFEQESDMCTENCNLEASVDSATCVDDLMTNIQFEQKPDMCAEKHDIVCLKPPVNSGPCVREGHNQEPNFDHSSELESEINAKLLQSLEQQYGQKSPSNTYIRIRTSVLHNLYYHLKAICEENKRLYELQKVSDGFQKTPSTKDGFADSSNYTLNSTLEETVHEEGQDIFQSPPVEFTDCVEQSHFPQGRIICDIKYVIEQARKLQNHSHECNFGGNLIFNKAIQRGLVYTYTFVCSKKLCNITMKLKSDREKAALNHLSVLGALSTGSGFSQEEQKFSIMNIPYMACNTFAQCEKVSGNIMKSFAKETMQMAIDEEKKIAAVKKDVNNDGSYNICAIVDGGWCKRSYGHGYNSSSGVAVIIGAATQKILYVSVRNKVCLICSATEEGRTQLKEHECSKNWTGPSTAMESNIIVEGLNYLDTVHNIKCVKVIGDGDTNLMKKVKEQVTYGKDVTKIECANHAVRRYFRALEKLQKNASRFSGVRGRQARKILTKQIARLTVGAREAIKRHATTNLADVDESKTKELASELLNGPAHVFGKHTHCGKFCKRKEEQDLTSYNIMNESGLMSAIMDELQRVLVSNVGSLIYNVTNNQAELFMSQLCKTLGGKRIDFSKSHSISRRTSIASLAFQFPGQKWQHLAHAKIAGASPKTPLRKFILRRQKKYVWNRTRRSLFKKKVKFGKADHVPRGGDEHYGDKASNPDLDEDALFLKSKMLILSLQVPSRDAVEEITRGQACCERWRDERRKRLSSTYFKDVAERRPTTLSANLVKRILYPVKLSIPAIVYGQIHEAEAVAVYEKKTNQKVIRCGLFVDPKNPMLCASPDGLIGSDGLLEVKCPFAARNVVSDISEVCEKHNIGIKKGVNGAYYLPKRHKYFYQIQGQLQMTDRNWCDLFVWCPKDNVTVRIDRDKSFWDSIENKLKSFYMECCVPEIVDSRSFRNLPLREPQHILEAIEEKKKSKLQKENKKSKKKPRYKKTSETIHFDADIPHSTPLRRDSVVQETSANSIKCETLAPDSNYEIHATTSPRPKRVRKSRDILDL